MFRCLRWGVFPSRICARAPLPTESRHAAGPFCVRTAGTASREPVARRDRVVVSTLRCGRSNPGSNPGHGSQLRRGRPAPFRHLTLQLGFAPTFGRHPVLPASSQESRRPSARRSRGREVKAMDLKSIGVSPRRVQVPVRAKRRLLLGGLSLLSCRSSSAVCRRTLKDVTEFQCSVCYVSPLRMFRCLRWGVFPSRICARAPLPTESRHTAGPFCVRTAGTASREPVARRDRVVVSTLRCGRSNPGSNPGHGSQLRRGRPAPFRHLTLQLGFAPTFGRHPVLPASSQESRRPSARRSRGRELCLPGPLAFALSAVIACGLRPVAPVAKELLPGGLVQVPVRAKRRLLVGGLSLLSCRSSSAVCQRTLKDVTEFQCSVCYVSPLRMFRCLRWGVFPSRICARAPLPTESRHAAGPFCVRTAGTASREPVARRDRVVVSTLRCGRSNPGSNPGHGSQLRRGRPAPFRHLTLQLGFAPTFGRHPVLPASSQESRRPSARRSRGREVKAMDLKSIGVSPRRFEPCRLRAAVRALPLAFCADSCAFQVQESDSQFMAFSPNFEAGNRAEDPRVAVVVAEWLRRWTRNPLGSPRAARICARAPLPTESRHAAGPFCVRTAGTASREPVARRDRIVVSTLRCGRSNPGSNPGHGSQLRRGRPAPFRHLTLQLGFAPTFGRHPVLPASSQESRRPSARRSRGREVKAMDLKSIGVSPRRFEPCRLRAAVRALPLAFCADSCAFQVQESDSQFMAFSPNFEAGNRAEDPRVAVVVAEWLRRWTRNPLGSPRAARICARAPLPTESRHTAGPFCVRTAGTASREPVARRDRVVVSTLRCGRSNPGSNPGHGSQLRRGRPAPFRHLTLQLGFAPTFGRHPVLPASSQESRRPSARRSRGRELCLPGPLAFALSAVIACGLRPVAPVAKELLPGGLVQVPVRAKRRLLVGGLSLLSCRSSSAVCQRTLKDVTEFQCSVCYVSPLRMFRCLRWGVFPSRICARAPLPTESRHAAGPFCVRTAGTASREPVARRDRVVVSTLRCGRSNPGSNPGHGSQLRRGRPAPFRHLTLQLGFAPTFGRHPVLPASSQESRRPSARRSRGREVKAMDLKSIGVSPRRFEPCRLRAAVRALPLAFCADSCAFQVQESDSQFMAFSPNFEAGNRAEDPRVAVVVAEWLRRWTRNPLGSPRAARICARAPLPTESRHAAGPFCVRTAGTASREPVARRDRIVVSTLRCGRSNPGSNPGHGSQLRRGRPAPFRHLTLQLGFAPTFGRHPVLPASSQESRRPSARRSRGREVKAMDLKSIGVSPRRFEPCRLRAAVRALPLAFCADSCAFQVQESDSQFMAFSPNFEAGNRAEDPRVAVVVAEWLRRWTRNPLGSPLAARICARTPLPTESRHAAGPFCVRTAGTASREPVARRDRIVVSTLRCGRSNPGSNPGHGSQLRRGRPAPFRHLTLQLGFAPTFGRHPVLPASSQESRRPSARRSRGREVKAMDLKSIGVSPRRFEPCRLRAAVRALPLAFCADSCAFQVRILPTTLLADALIAEEKRLGPASLARICARAPLPTESRHAAGPFCVRTAGTASREPVARRDRIVVSTLRCGLAVVPVQLCRVPAFEPCRLRAAVRALPLAFCADSCAFQVQESDSQFMAFSPNFEAGNRAEDPRVAVVVAEWWTRNPLGSPRAATPVRIRVTAANCDVDVLLLFATSPFSWVLRLHLGGILCCPPPAKRAGGPLPGVVVAERSFSLRSLRRNCLRPSSRCACGKGASAGRLAALRRWTRNPLGSPRAARICARAPLPTESRHAAGPFCVRTAGTASREPVARRDRIVVSTLRCGLAVVPVQLCRVPAYA
ncbi:hypothetical protein QQF64_016503 [Cirrhinus molitorella]|uniref:Uncharacterized protein n=1 Tax=Cirrhinus molitorella TaxID=172907 RepID=A0ABR3LR85_9TELE